MEVVELKEVCSVTVDVDINKDLKCVISKEDYVNLIRASLVDKFRDELKGRGVEEKDAKRVNVDLDNVEWSRSWMFFSGKYKATFKITTSDYNIAREVKEAIKKTAEETKIFKTAIDVRTASVEVAAVKDDLAAVGGKARSTISYNLLKKVSCAIGFVAIASIACCAVCACIVCCPPLGAALGITSTAAIIQIVAFGTVSGGILLLAQKFRQYIKAALERNETQTATKTLDAMKGQLNAAIQKNSEDISRIFKEIREKITKEYGIAGNGSVVSWMFELEERSKAEVKEDQEDAVEEQKVSATEYLWSDFQKIAYAVVKNEPGAAAAGALYGVETKNTISSKAIEEIRAAIGGEAETTARFQAIKRGFMTLAIADLKINILMLMREQIINYGDVDKQSIIERNETIKRYEELMTQLEQN